jgi:hypothetical protein
MHGTLAAMSTMDVSVRIRSKFGFSEAGVSQHMDALSG